jgi:hypothetical protein
VTSESPAPAVNPGDPPACCLKIKGRIKRLHLSFVIAGMTTSGNYE